MVAEEWSDKVAFDMEVHMKKTCHWIPLCGKNGTHWHSLTLTEQLWRPTSGYEHSEEVGGAFQQWWEQPERQAMFHMAMQLAQVFMNGMSAVVSHWQKCIANSGDYVEK